MSDGVLISALISALISVLISVIMSGRVPRQQQVEDNILVVFGVDVAAELLGVCRNTVTRWCREGRLPARQFGRKWHFHRDTFMSEIAKNPAP